MKLFSITELLEIEQAIKTHLNIDVTKAETLSILKQKGKLNAVKYLKERTGWTLAESKNFCDLLERNFNDTIQIQ